MFGVLFQLMVFVCLALLIQHTYNECWEHRMEGRRGHAIVHGVFLVGAVVVLIALVARVVMRNL